MQLFKILPTITNRRLILPFYHAVTNNAPIHLKHLYNVRSVKIFENDLDFLLRTYKPVSVNDIYDHLQGIKKLPRYSFFISFDDGLTEFKQYVWPVLIRKGISAALFVNPAFVDNKELFFRFKAGILIDFIKNNKNTKLLNEANKVFSSIIESVDGLENFVRGVNYAQSNFLNDLATYFNIDFNNYLEKHKPYLGKADLEELKEQGVHIGAHSTNHPLFSQLKHNEQVNQLQQSVDWVKHNFNQNINTFAYPFTDYGIGAAFFNTVFNPHKPLAQLTFGTAGLKKEKFRYHLQRIPVENYNANMQQILQQQYFYYIAKAVLFKNTIRR